MEESKQVASASMLSIPGPGSVPIRMAVLLVEEAYIRWALSETASKAEAARLLGINRTTLVMKMKRLQIPLDRYEHEQNN